MPDCGEVHANLMRPSGVQVSAKEIDRLESRQSNEVRLCRPAGRNDGDSGAIARIPRQWFVDGHAIVGEMSPGEGRVPPPNGARLKCGTEHAMGTIRLGDQQES